MNPIYKSLRHKAANVVRSLHPRAIAWQVKYGNSLRRPLITSLGKTGHLKVRIYSNDVIGRAIYQWGVFEESEVRLITGFLEPGMVFFDVGANLGQYTLLAAEKVGESGQVHSFEPGPRMFEELSFNVSLNALDRRCILNNVALSDQEGRARLSRYPPGAEVYSSLGKHAYPGNEVTGYDEVSTTTLDSYIERRSIDNIHLVKMDIEGAELLALRGGSALLRRANAPAIVIEMADVNTVGFDYRALDIWDYLSSFGYAWFRFDNQGRISQAVRPDSFNPARNLLAVKYDLERWIAAAGGVLKK